MARHFQRLGGESKAHHVHSTILLGIGHRSGTHDNETTVVASSLDEPREFPGDRNEVPRSDRNLRAIDYQPAVSPKNRIRTLHPAVKMIIRHSADNSTLHNSSALSLRLSLMHLSNGLAAG